MNVGVIVPAAGLGTRLAAAEGAEGTWYGLVRRTEERAARMGRTAQVDVTPRPGGFALTAVGACSEVPDGQLHTTFAELRCAEHEAMLGGDRPDDSQTLPALQELARRGLLFGVELSGDVLDAGVPAGYDDARARFDAGAASWRAGP